MYIPPCSKEGSGMRRKQRQWNIQIRPMFSPDTLNVYVISPSFCLSSNYRSVSKWILSGARNLAKESFKMRKFRRGACFQAIQAKPAVFESHIDFRAFSGVRRYKSYRSSSKTNKDICTAIVVQKSTLKWGSLENSIRRYRSTDAQSMASPSGCRWRTLPDGEQHG